MTPAEVDMQRMRLLMRQAAAAAKRSVPIVIQATTVVKEWRDDGKPSDASLGELEVVLQTWADDTTEAMSDDV